MPEIKKEIRVYTDIEDIAHVICKLQDEYAKLYALKKFNSQYILKELNKMFPEYSMKTIVEFMKPIQHIKDAVNAGTWVPNKVKDSEFVSKLEDIFNNLKHN